MRPDPERSHLPDFENIELDAYVPVLCCHLMGAKLGIEESCGYMVVAACSLDLATGG